MPVLVTSEIWIYFWLGYVWPADVVAKLWSAAVVIVATVAAVVVVRYNVLPSLVAIAVYSASVSVIT